MVVRVLMFWYRMLMFVGRLFVGIFLLVSNWINWCLLFEG